MVVEGEEGDGNWTDNRRICSGRHTGGSSCCCGFGAAEIRVDVANTAGMSSGCQISVRDLTAWSV